MSDDNLLRPLDLDDDSSTVEDTTPSTPALTAQEGGMLVGAHKAWDIKDTEFGKIASVQVVDEMRKSYLDYAMSVIVSRALPDARDGLKPVHRRILYSMHDLKMTPDKSYSKCARVVGDVLGRFHPHGDASVYMALVR